MIQFAVKVNIRLIPQLISGFSKKGILKYFNSGVICIFAIPALFVLLESLDLSLNDSQSVMLSLGSPLWYYHRLSNVFS